MGKATFLAHIRSLQLNLRQVLEETKDSKLGTVIGHELYPEFIDVKQELTKRGYPAHSVDIFLHVCREMVDTYKSGIGMGMTPKADPNVTPRAKLMEVIKKWESDGIFGRDAGEAAGSQKCEGGPKGRELEMSMEVSKATKRMEVRNEEQKKEVVKGDDSGKKGMKRRKATEQSQRIAVSDTEFAAVSENSAKRLKCKALTQSEMEPTREAGSEKLVLERAGREEGLKSESELSIVQRLQEENATLRAQVDSLIQSLKTQDKQIAELLNGMKNTRSEERRGGEGASDEEQEVIGLLFGEVDSSAAMRMSRDRCPQ